MQWCWLFFSSLYYSYNRCVTEVGAKCQRAVLGKVGGMSHNYTNRVMGIFYTIGVWECVEPLHGIESEFYNYYLWHLVVREGMTCALYAFLDCAVATFNFRDMFVYRDYV